MDNRTILIALHHLEGIGWKTIDRIVKTFPELTDILSLDTSDWLELGISSARSEALAGRLRAFTEIQAKALLEPYALKNIGMMTVFDDNYPELLKQTSQPPWVLYTRGNPELLSRPCIAVVGTRTPTAYGRQSAEQLSASLSSASVCIVSGLARGIDSAAHEGAIKHPGGTIAVLGCSIDQVYPPENKYLYGRLIQEALVISEYPMGTRSHPGLFPQRNRIIAGLSLGVLVIEAALKSGSLITADQALEESRDIYALPGPINSPKSQGALGLIKQGAKLITCAEDILDEYPHLRAIRAHLAAGVGHQSQAIPLSSEEEQIVHLLQDGALTIDELLARSQFTFGHLHAVLLNLLMIKRVEQLPGSVYVLC
ncbi:DNA-processing protein DprA [Paenibacillus rigui]|uniref:DNA-protecting protein DprA n=1 Tax=Paenibacillus rigui TaxID=554312 RepID=A0A229UMJ7_9BACL|nr:DNA-processing protein DprA [Paenibacillus rigui]OXM84656.1 DNA-protecting protein DprA [Paenibacillus rigui]